MKETFERIAIDTMITRPLLRGRKSYQHVLYVTMLPNTPKPYVPLRCTDAHRVAEKLIVFF